MNLGLSHISIGSHSHHVRRFADMLKLFAHLPQTKKILLEVSSIEYGIGQ